jgi:urease subunit gamma/beta
VQLTPTERDRLLLFNAAELARRRRDSGLLLNVPEATALIADTVCEAARAGARLAEAIVAGRGVLRARDVLPGVVDLVPEVYVEAVFQDGTRLAVVTDPFGGHGPDDGGLDHGGQDHGGQDHGALGDAAPGAVLPAPETSYHREPVVSVTVRNNASVPISVTSHFHFFETNARLEFDRAAAYGMRLAAPAGASTRFDPDKPLVVGLVPIGGARVAIGFSGLVDGPLDAPGAKEKALRRAQTLGYLGVNPYRKELP